jgi:hypothetical protein
VLPEFTRALNARSIMSDQIPLMSSESEFLHTVFWHPQVAAEVNIPRDCILYHIHPDAAILADATTAGTSSKEANQQRVAELNG